MFFIFSPDVQKLGRIFPAQSTEIPRTVREGFQTNKDSRVQGAAAGEARTRITRVRGNPNFCTRLFRVTQILPCNVQECGETITTTVIPKPLEGPVPSPRFQEKKKNRPNMNQQQRTQIFHEVLM